MLALIGKISFISLLLTLSCSRQSTPILPKTESLELKSKEISKMSMAESCAIKDIGKCIKCIRLEKDNIIIEGCIKNFLNSKDDCFCEAFIDEFDQILIRASNKSNVLLKLKNYCANKCSIACDKIGSIYRKIRFQMDEIGLFTDATELFCFLCKNGGDATYCDFFVQLCEVNSLKPSCLNIDEIINEEKSSEMDKYYDFCGSEQK